MATLASLAPARAVLPARDRPKVDAALAERAATA